MKGFGLLGLVISFAIVAILTRTQHRNNNARMAKELSAMQQLEIQYQQQQGTTEVNVDELNKDPEAVKKQLELQMQERMRAIENQAGN